MQREIYWIDKIFRNGDIRAKWSQLLPRPKLSQMNRRVILSAFLAFLSIGCSGSNLHLRGVVDYLAIKRPPLPAPGTTIAGPGLQEDVLNMILGIDGARHQECKNYGLKNTEMVEPPGSGDRKWKERWILDRCGTEVAWDVQFTPDPKGGTNIVTSIPKE